MRTQSLNKLFRSELLDLQPYPASLTDTQLAKQFNLQPSAILKLDSAENSLMEDLYSMPANLKYYSYPDPFSTDLRKAIGKYVGYDSDWLACGNGSDELIDLLISLFVSADEEMLICPPTFPMYEFFAKIRGVKVRKILRNKELLLDMPKLIAGITSETKLIFIDSPGNPAGTLIAKSDIIQLLEKNLIVVVDEAYFEYCGQTVAPLVRQYPNLIVIRTLSKWAGLAGLRVGYMIANPDVIDQFNIIKPPYNVNAAAQQQAIYALNNSEKFLARLETLLLSRPYMVQTIKGCSPKLDVSAGEGSYVIVRLTGIDCLELTQKLRAEGIIIKPVKQPLLSNVILVGLTDQINTDRLAQALSGILKPKEKRNDKDI